MPVTLNVGKELAMPLDLVTRTTAIVGQRGTGKTSTAVVLVEEAAKAGAQFAVIDPTGAWYGLRSSANGKGAGLKVVVFGGHHADLPLEHTAGAFMARLVVEQAVNVVLDLELMTKQKQVQFVAEFALELYYRNRSALTLVIDEAHRFAPQQLREPGGFGAKCLGAVTDVVALGRRKGLGAVLVSQRPATINKDVFEQAEVLFAHRLMGPNDQKAILGWLHEVDDDTYQRSKHMTTRTLERGQAVVYAPTYEKVGRFVIRPKRTFDSSATPEVGASLVEPKGRADVDLDAIREAMGEAIERAKADDPAELKRRIVELERALRDVEPEEVEVRVEVPVMPDGLRERLLSAVDRVLAEDPANGYARMPIKAEAWPEPDPALPKTQTFGPARPPRMITAEARPVSTIYGTGLAAGRVEAPVELRAGALRMLAVAGSQHPRPLTRAQLGTLAAIKHTGGTFSAYLSALKRGGYLVEDGKLAITDAGFELLGGKPAAPATPEEVRAMWSSKLRAGARRMLDALINERWDAANGGHNEAWMTRSALATEVGIEVSGGTFSAYLSQLRSAGLIEEDGNRLRAGDVLFLAAS